MKRDFLLGFEQLDNKVLLSANLWYIDAIKAPEVWKAVSSSNNKPVVAIVDSVNKLSQVIYTGYMK